MDFIQKIRNVLSRNTSNIQNAINGRRETVINSSNFNILLKQLDIVIKEEINSSAKISLVNSFKVFNEKKVLSEKEKELLNEFIIFTNKKPS